MVVKSAYSHPKIKEEFYTEQPSRFKKLDPSKKQFVCRLNISIYGLKQAAKSWYEELVNFLVEHIFVSSKNDYSFFSKKKKGKKLILSWVDDLVLAGSSLEDLEESKNILETKFEMADRGKLG